MKLGAGRRSAAWGLGLWLAVSTPAWPAMQIYVVESEKPEAGHDLILVEKEAAKDGTSTLLEPGGAEKKIATDKIVARLTPEIGRAHV